jgi:hypothetical protein
MYIEICVVEICSMVFVKYFIQITPYFSPASFSVILISYLTFLESLHMHISTNVINVHSVCDSSIVGIFQPNYYLVPKIFSQCGNQFSC